MIWSTMIHSCWGRCLLLQLLYTIRKSLKDLYFSEFSGWAFEKAGYQGSEGWRLVSVVPPRAKKRGDLWKPYPGPGNHHISHQTGKVKSSSKYLWQEGYVSSQEGKSYHQLSSICLRNPLDLTRCIIFSIFKSAFGLGDVSSLQGKGISRLGNSPLPLLAQAPQGGWDGSPICRCWVFPVFRLGWRDDGAGNWAEYVWRNRRGWSFVHFLGGDETGDDFPNKSHTKTHKEWESHGWVFYLKTVAAVVFAAVFNRWFAQGEVRGGCATSSTAGRRRDEYANPGAASAEPCHVMTWFNTGWAGDIITQWVCLEVNYTKIGSDEGILPCFIPVGLSVYAFMLLMSYHLLNIFKLFQSYQDEQIFVYSAR